jgi:glycosyltransferase involved in cell wall biosynthesis
MPVSGSTVPQRVFMTADAVGGVWSYALELACGLSERGIAVQLAVLGPEPNAAQFAAADTIPSLSLVATCLPLDWTARSEAELERTVGELKLLARQFDADLVHLHAPALAGSRRWTVPLVVSMHSCLATWWDANRSGPMPGDFVWRTRKASRGMAMADCTIVPSRSFAADVEKLYGQGVVVSAVRNGRRAWESKPVSKRPEVFTAGRLWDEGKNVRAIDRAAGRIGWPVHAAGPVDGPNGARASLTHLHLLGTLSDAEMAERYRRAGVFVSTPRYEPFGLTVLEAAQAGAALVLSDIATFRELWDGAACFIPLDDDDALTATLEDLAARPEWREHWAERARERAGDYTAARMVEGTLDVYSDVLAVRYKHAV